MTTKTLARYDHYRPHKRVVEDGTIYDRATGEFVKPPSMTKQSHKEECDINNIIKTFKVSGMVTHVNSKAQLGAYVDLPDNMDFQTALETVRLGEEAFASLPSKVRREFENSPEAFLGFMASDHPDDRARAVELGLIKAPIADTTAAGNGQAPPPDKPPAAAAAASPEPPKA